MIRVVSYLLIVGLLAFAAAWLADRPGDVVITWQGRRIETSVMVLIIAVTAVAVLAAMLWSLARGLMRSPDLIWRYLAAPRRFRSSKPYPLFLRRLLLGPIYVGGGGRGSVRSGSAADPAQAPRPRQLVPREASWSNTGPPGRWRCER